MTRADEVHHGLRAALLAGAFPYGQRLVEEQLAERFNTSRTPVREALRRLEGDGHVVRDRSGGVRPNAPRVTAMRELYAVRTVLEDLAVRTADRTVQVTETPTAAPPSMIVVPTETGSQIGRSHVPPAR